ncbi:MAG: insulinase family protein [Anaerolineales bacterium]|nr:insulinase family protein [Anaerolineales bacterium]
MTNRQTTPQVIKKVLANGLTVLLQEMNHAPVASFMVWYRVGSRHEKPGITGISHWVEHMMFKGTPAFPNGSLDRLISREGGYNNAFTWLDYTAYYETLPAHRIELALQIEADRMVHTRMTPKEVEAERTVILSERGMYENDPRFALNEELTAAAFRVHPYHHEIIGDVSDLTTMTRDDLYGFYRSYYAPNNAIVVVVGDFEAESMLSRIEGQFGDLPMGEPLPPVVRQEPVQKGERRVAVNGADPTSHLVVAYRAPAADHPDYFPLTLLNAALAGGSSLGMFGGGGSNKSCRLYKALVDTDLAVNVSGSLVPTIDPFLYAISAVVRNGHTAAEVEAALDAELVRLATEPMSQVELDKALKRAKAEFVLSSESMTGQAQLLGMAEAVVGDYRWFETVLGRLTAVSLSDIERVRQTYLQKRNRVVGWYEPEE